MGCCEQCEVGRGGSVVSVGLGYMGLWIVCRQVQQRGAAVLETGQGARHLCICARRRRRLPEPSIGLWPTVHRLKLELTLWQRRAVSPVVQLCTVCVRVSGQRTPAGHVPKHCIIRCRPT